MRLTEDPVKISWSIREAVVVPVVAGALVSLRKTDENLDREKYLFGFLLLLEMKGWVCKLEGNNFVWR